MISIHAPREGGDREVFFMSNIDKQFQSTPPARGATSPIRTALRGFLISIHAPREGGDPMLTSRSAPGEISIHAPREGGDAP